MDQPLDLDVDFIRKAPGSGTAGCPAITRAVGMPDGSYVIVGKPVSAETRARVAAAIPGGIADDEVVGYVPAGIIRGDQA